MSEDIEELRAENASIKKLLRDAAALIEDLHKAVLLIATDDSFVGKKRSAQDLQKIARDALNLEIPNV